MKKKKTRKVGTAVSTFPVDVPTRVVRPEDQQFRSPAPGLLIACPPNLDPEKLDPRWDGKPDTRSIMLNTKNTFVKTENKRHAHDGVSILMKRRDEKACRKLAKENGWLKEFDGWRGNLGTKKMSLGNFIRHCLLRYGAVYMDGRVLTLEEVPISSRYVDLYHGSLRRRTPNPARRFGRSFLERQKRRYAKQIALYKKRYGEEPPE